MVIIQAIVNALASAFDMFWEVLWPLALGFLLSAIVQTLVSRNAVARTLGSDSPRSLGFATFLGAASSSCSYAAVAIARSLFLKGASFPAAIVFEFASTNLVFELGLILLILLGWPFLGAEFAGGVLMILILALLFRWTLRPQLVDQAREHAARLARPDGRPRRNGHGDHRGALPATAVQRARADGDQSQLLDGCNVGLDRYRARAAHRRRARVLGARIVLAGILSHQPSGSL